MKRHQLTLISAIAIVLAGVWVALRTMKAPEGCELSAEVTEALKQRQAERHRESGRTRQHHIKIRPHDHAALKEQLLAKFPNLRVQPTHLNASNSIYYLDQLLDEVNAKEKHLGVDLWRAMSEDSDDKLQLQKEVLNRYAWILEKLKPLPDMELGSYYNEQGNHVMLSSHALMTLIRLARLDESVDLQENVTIAMMDSVILRARLETIIGRSKGAPMANRLMTMPAFDRKDFHVEVDLNLKSWATGHPITPVWHQPYVGESLNSEMLTREARRSWWQCTLEDPFLTEPVTMDPISIRAYAHHVSQTLSRLETQSIEEFMSAEMPPLDSNDLSSLQVQQTLEMIASFHEQLNRTIRIGLMQHQEMVAIRLRNSESDGHDIQSQVSEVFNWQPITLQPYLFDSETRMLSRLIQLDGYTIPPTRINKPHEGGVWNTPLIPEKY